MNKIDSPNAQIDRVTNEINSMLGYSESEIFKVSAKTGEGVEDLIKEIIKTIPSPVGDKKNSLQALVFDSKYDQFKGVISYVKIVNGELKKGEKIISMGSGKTFEALETGIFSPTLKEMQKLSLGEVGYIATGLKNLSDCRVGETITLKDDPSLQPLKGYESAKPMVYSGLYPTDGDEYPFLRDALGKLQLNDASFVFEPESSGALGFGFRCGFLGLLHLEVVRDRIEREYDINLITTAPSVIYHVLKTDNEKLEIHNPADLPDAVKIQHIEEPRIKATILVPDNYLGEVLKLCQDRRGIQLDLTYVGSRAMAVYDLPLNEVVFDFYDRLKSVTKGYASFDYEITKYVEDNLVKMQILVNDEPVDALSIIVHRDRAEMRGRSMCEKLKDLIPQHLFKIPIQASLGGRIIARETISALRKDVTAKCYGGDITRKRKLLEKQKAGKKRMRQFGKVEIPQEAFVNALKIND